MIAHIFRFFNINLQPHQALPAASYFLSLVLHSYYGPMLMKTAITELPPQWLSFETVWCCLASLAIGIMWKGGFRKAAIRNFAVLAIIESCAGFCLSIWLVFVAWNVWVYAVFALFYVSVVSLTVGRCVMVFKTKLWNEKSREAHDNTQSGIGDIALLSGGIAAIVACPSLNVALILFGISCIVDDIGWIITWFRLKDQLEEK